MTAYKDPLWYRIAFSFLVVGTGWGHIAEWCGGPAWARAVTTLSMGVFHFVLSTRPSLLKDCDNAWRRWRALRAEKYPSHKPRTF